jgi:transcriptional regulator with XRE-family HTH domain
MKANQTRLAKMLSTRDMRLADLAKALRVNKTTVSRWALGEIPTGRLEDVSKKTGISAHDLRPDLASVFSTEPESAS